MSNSILTPTQKHLLVTLGKSEQLAKKFCFSGGTVLSEFYLHHRYSEDLDFFSPDEVDTQAIISFLKGKQSDLHVDSFEIQQSFNRNLFFLTIGEEVLKTEFTYFPFSAIEPGEVKYGFRIDSLLDIAVNKLFTIYQQSRARDYIDLYCICRERQWTIDELTQKAKVKFDWHIDPLQLGAQFLKATEAKDYPRMLIELPDTAWQNFFTEEAKKLQDSVIE